VRTVIPTADRQKATVKVRLTFDELDPKILPDMGVKVAFQEIIPVEETATPPQSLAPLAAIRQIDGRPVVFVVSDDTLDRRAVSLGRESGADVEIIAGVGPGERVVVSGPENLEDGQQVRVKSSEF
jgi:multidrug efflux pump subunit AcrA (membrane-fusion protein)